MTERTPDEVRETLEAISAGEVDAVVVHGPRGPQVYRLEGPDQPFRTFVERMQEGALTVGGDGTILYANSYFADLVGFGADELVGKMLTDFVAPQYRSTVVHLVEQGLDGKMKGHCVLEGGSGGISVQLTLSPLVGGTQPSCCVVVFDLREREAAEEAHAARLAAEQANLAKDQFLAVLSHELRSPLNAILGWAQILAADTSLGEDARRAAQTIERNSRTQAQLIGDLLDISRIIAGKLNLEMGSHEFDALVEAVVSGARPLADDRGVKLSLRTEGSIPIYGDATRVQQIIMNLLSNALKFTERGGEVIVSLSGTGESAELSVRDTGVGMDKTLLDRAFQIFHQGGSTRRRQGGLGLGLAIARELAEAHGGSLAAVSEGEGRGSTFTLRLPRAATTARRLQHELSPRGELDGVLALVVDDEDDNLELTRYFLERSGCAVVTASSAEEALNALESHHFGLIVSDIGLPIQDGLDLMREVRARGHSAESLPAIALTGYAGHHDARLVAAAGYQKHLSKPVDAALLLKSALELGRRQK